jgi:hypothetical protein
MTSRFIPTSRESTRLCAGVLAALRAGRANAVTGSSLARAFREPDDRKIRAVIRELIHEGHAIASAVSEPMGYYIVASADEAFDYIRALGERIKEDEARLADFRAAVRDMKIPEQLNFMQEVAP